MNRGDKYRPVVTVLKVKNGVPTVIRVAGREYVLRAPDQFNQRKKGAVKRGRGWRWARKDDRSTVVRESEVYGADYRGGRCEV